jgi:hypothetical protein
MTTGIYQEAATMAQEQFTDRGLWTAVLLQAMDDWKSGNRKLQKEAEKFFFDSASDFAMVCRAAGLEAAAVLNRLQKMRKSAQVRSNYDLSLAA